MTTIAIILLLFILFLAIKGLSESEKFPKIPQKKLYIIGNGKKYSFNVDIPDTNAFMKGLMGVQNIPDDYGMYFKFPFPQQASFWMKNTPSPLDILFIDARGQIMSIEQGTPMSEKKIWSPGPVIGVLEIRGGVSTKLGIKPGYYVQF
jgi:uncharacterized membrane protein (UPF0127 family)